jgi:hypothetical protein
MSVPPTASSNAITGVAATNRVHRITCWAPTASSASAKSRRKATPNQTRGSASVADPNSARGTPNSDITGR